MIIVDYNDIGIKRGLWQYDFGQVLRIQGGNLKPAVEIHFSLQETGGEAVTRIGTTKDGVTDVVIPDTMLINDETEDKYKIYVFIYIADSQSGETEKKFTLEVKSRPKPEAFDAPEDKKLFEEAIRAVNESAERAETAERQAAQHAEQTKADAQKTTADRQEVEKLVDSVSGIEEQVQAVKEYKEQAQTAATNALLSEQKSNEAKEAALQAQAGAEQHALDTAGDKTEVERLATQVRQDKSSVEQTAQGFGNTVQQAEQSINTAKTKAVETVRTEGTTQTGNVTAEGEKQVQAVQAKGQEVINSLKITNRVELSETDTTVELEPNKLYVFPEMANITYELKEPTDKSIVNEYHFVFQSGASPTQVVHPVGVKIGNFSVEANKIYEVSIMENLLTSQSWEE